MELYQKRAPVGERFPPPLLDSIVLRARSLAGLASGTVIQNQTTVSNSRPSECNSSWFAHFDSDKMMRHHRDVEKDLRYGLLEPEPARFRRSSACFGS